MKMYHMAVIFFAVLIFLSCTQNDLKPGGSGLIEATEITVSVESGGRLLKIFFKEGDKINKNDTIALIDTLTISLRLNQALAAYDAAQIKINSASIAVEQAESNLVLSCSGSQGV
jgi:HlyD family secretion protein